LPELRRPWLLLLTLPPPSAIELERASLKAKHKFLIKIFPIFILIFYGYFHLMIFHFYAFFAMDMWISDSKNVVLFKM
jgi:hypothetical protein